MAEELNKITADQLAIIREITRKRDRLIYDLGLNEFNSLKLESEKSEIKKSLIELAQRDAEMFAEISKIHGKVEVDLETGEVRKIS